MTHLYSFQPDEHEIVRVRKHWFVLTVAIFGTILAAFLPVILALIIIPALIQGAPGVLPLIFFFGSLWVVLCIIALANIWTSFYLDIWIVTNKRIMYIEQVRLFSREVTTLRIDRIQDATVTYHNFIETMLGFGTLRIQSAGAVADDLEIRGIPKPDHVKQIVLNEVEKESKRRFHVDYDRTVVTDEMTGA